MDATAEEVRPADSERERSDADEYKPPAEALVVRDDDPQDVFRVMDLADEELILDEIQGRALGAMVYSFVGKDGKRQTGLSYWGVAEAVRTLNVRSAARVRVNPSMLDKEIVEIHGEAHHRVTVYAEDEQAGGGVFGAAEVPLKMKLKSGKKVDDPFSYRKALSKAQRNALRAMVPITWQQTLIAQYLGDETKVRRLRAHGLEPKQIDRPPALVDEQALELNKRLVSLYDELKETNRTVMTPATFNQWMLETQHSYERMEAFVAHLEHLLEVEQGREAKAQDEHESEVRA